MKSQVIRNALERANLGVAALAMILGALGGLGRPGMPVPWLYLASAGALLYLAALCTTFAGAVVCGAAWGIGLFPIVTIGALSWGWIVPVSFTAFGVSCYAVPLSVWSWWASHRLGGWKLFAATTLAWSLWMEVGDLLAFPWKGDLLTVASVAPWLLGGARLVGGNLVSGIVMATLLGASTYVARSNAPTRGARWAMVPLFSGIALLSGLSLLGRQLAPPSDNTLQVGVVQPNADHVYYQSRLVAPTVVAEFEATMVRLLAELEQVDLLVFTESYDGKYGLELPPLLARWQQRAKERHQSVLLTSYLVEPDGRKSNAVGGIDSTGRLVGIHRKVDLAPFGESPLAAGIDYRVLSVREGAEVGALICRESCLPTASHAMVHGGAKLLVASTSDVTFFSSVLAFEHLAITQVRAIESGRTIVWASNGGPSCIIDRYGALHDRVPFRQPAALRATAPLYSDITPYMRFERSLRYGSLVVLLALLVAFRRELVVEGLRPIRSLPALANRGARGAAMLLAVGFSGALASSSAAIVEWTQGRRGHAMRAMSEMLMPPAALEPLDPYERFRTTKELSAAGAIAYFLTYYGVETESRQIAEVSGATTLEELQDLLQLRFGVRTKLIYIGTELPRVAAIVQLADGSYAVMTNAFGEMAVTFFLPTAGKNLLVPAAEASKLARRALAVIPALMLEE